MNFKEYITSDITEASIKQEMQKNASTLLRAATALYKLEQKVIKDYNMDFLPDDYSQLEDIVEAAKAIAAVSRDDDFWEELEK